MPDVSISAEPRSDFGKGAARRLRRAGSVPAVIYGGGTELQHVSLPAHDLMLALKRPKVTLAVQVAGGSVTVAPRQVQRDPVRQVIEHVDLVVISAAEARERAAEAEVIAAAEAAQLEAGLDPVAVAGPASAAVESGVDSATAIAPGAWRRSRPPAGRTPLRTPQPTPPMSRRGGRQLRGRRGAGRDLRARESGPLRVAQWARRWRRGQDRTVTDSAPWLVVGLGNPGPEYASTRHNVGAMAVEVLADRMGARLAAHRRGRAEVAEGRLAGRRAVLARPRSYMNESGGPVAALLAFYKVTPDRLVVIHDELDIGFGTLRCKLGGGDNGHNGLKSSGARWGPASSCASASGSAARRAARIRRTTCCGLRQRRAQGAALLVDAAADAVESSSPTVWRSRRAGSTAEPWSGRTDVEKITRFRQADPGAVG